MTEQELRDLWAQIAGAVGDKDEGGKFTLRTIARVAKENAHAVFQHVFNVGHSERNKTATTEAQGLQDQITAKDAEITRLTGELETAKAGQPDATKKVGELEGQIRTLQATHAAEKKALQAAVTEATRAAKLETLRAKLTGGEGDRMDSVYAEVLMLDPKVRERIRMNEDGTFDVLQATGGIPFAPADGKDGLDLLAAELIDATRRSKPVLIVSGAEAGSGTGSTGGRASGDGRGGGNGKGAAFYEGIRKDVAEGERAKAPEGGTGAQRLGIKNVGATQ